MNSRGDTLRTAFLYPGQGGLPEGLPPTSTEVERLYEIAAAEGLPLAEWMSAGDGDRFVDTEVAQPAILIDSLARDGALRQAGLSPTCVAGHSLGEYAALVAAGAIAPDDALRLVIERGRLMGSVAGAMAAIVKLAVQTVRALCERVGPEVVVANHNGPSQTVVSGTEGGVDRVIEMAQAAGGRGIRLRVSGPFHSPFMEPAQRALGDAIDRIAFREPSVSFVSGVTGELEDDVDRLRELMKVQMTSCVRWVDVVDRLVTAGVTCAVEVGAGSVLTNLGKRITDRIRFVTYEEAADGGV